MADERNNPGSGDWSETDTPLDDSLIFSHNLPPLPPANLNRGSGGLGGLGGLGGAAVGGKNIRDEEIQFRRKLLKFARHRQVTIDDKGVWYFVALHLAAYDHPELDIQKRKRGRPRKTEGGGLLSSLLGGTPLKSQELEAERLVRRIDTYNAKLKPGGKKVTDARVAQLQAEQENVDYPDLVPSSKQKWAKLLSAARKRIGAQKRSRVIPK
ncbi:MAG: hypothetical protein WA975_10675 [Mesorhizobium sp.]